MDKCVNTVIIWDKTFATLNDSSSCMYLLVACSLNWLDCVDPLLHLHHALPG